MNISNGLTFGFPELTKQIFHTYCLSEIPSHADIALKHINRASIEVNDLWKVVIDHPEYYAGGDGTHPIDAGYSALANQVIKVIKNVLVH